MLRNLVATAVLLSATAGVAWSQDAKPTEPPKCSALPPKSFPASPPTAAVKQGRFAACMPAKDCKETEDKAKNALASAFCAMNHLEACRLASCDKPTLMCVPELRPKGTTGIKLSNCVSRASKIACPKDGEEICLCDLEVEAKGAISCGSTCVIAPTPTPSAR